MRPRSIMFIAGEASGDMLAAELVRALRARLTGDAWGGTTDVQPLGTSLEPRFFGAGGPRMAAAGVELSIDLTQHAVFGLVEVFKQVAKFRRIGLDLLRLAARRQPDMVVLVDYAGFNRRFAAAVKRLAGRQRGAFGNWRPKVVYFVSPQVWASRESRAFQLERDVDLLLSIFPFEKDWYARRVPRLRVEFVGHPMIDRFRAEGGGRRTEDGGRRVEPLVLLLPGSRVQELRRHLPIMRGAVERIRAAVGPVRVWMVLPHERLVGALSADRGLEVGQDWDPGLVQAPASGRIRVSIGRLPELLAAADLALASSGTVTMECAWFRVPTVVMYKVAWPTYWVARWMVKVPFIAMPNLLAGERLYPEFIQGAATSEAVAGAGVELLRDAGRRGRVVAGLDRVIASLGGPGACERAAHAVASLLGV